MAPAPPSAGQVVGLVLSELLLGASLGIHLLLATATAWSLRGCDKPVWMALWVWLPVVAVLGTGIGQIVVFFRIPAKRTMGALVVALVAATVIGTSGTVAYQADAAMARWCD
ncbi:MAG: hypothetical protein JW751_10920 [Polyangiaceae bacterium]|nr:hypothetical protein [Polyangiaceae bacterium]